MQYKVVKNYSDAPERPIQIKKGEILQFIEESDPYRRWPNWIRCKGQNKEGWVPKQILKRIGEDLLVLETYTAREHNLLKDEVLISEKELNGWIWCSKETEPDTFGWAPLNHLEEIIE